MARHRYAVLPALCALAVCAYFPASSALAAHRAGASSLHQHAGHHSRRHGRCGQNRRPRGARHGHAQPSSFHSGARPRHGAGSRCRRRFGANRRHSRKRGVQHRKGRPQHRSAAANSSVCADADLAPSPTDLDRVRAATLCLVNHERALHGARPLTLNAHLAQAAQAHSDDMASGDYFEHVGPGGDTPSSRMRASGYIYSSQVGYEIGENIGWGTLWLATPRAMVVAWMGSAGHRANILDPRFTDTGIGVAPHGLSSASKGQAGAIYTEDFGLIITG